MKLFFDYLNEKKREIVGLVLMEGVTGLVLWLNELPLGGTAYAMFLGLVVFLLCMGGDFFRYYRKRKRLEILRKAAGNELALMPDATHALEREYQEIIAELLRQKKEQESAFDMKWQEMLDYYGLWVHQIKTPIAGMNLLLQAQKEELLAKEELETGSPDEPSLDVRLGMPGNREEPSLDVHLGMLGNWNRRMSMELDRVERYVELALSYLRMEDMGKDLVLQKYPLEKVIKKAVKKFSRDFLYRKIRLEMESFTMTVLSDEKWILLVVEQLLSNALKYTPENGKVRIYAVSGEKKLVIEDTGIGIPKEELPRVCEKGFTGYNGRENRKSTGIGLYLCRTIMDRLNHGLTIESEVGVGTKVILDFEREELEVE